MRKVSAFPLFLNMFKDKRACCLFFQIFKRKSFADFNERRILRVFCGKGRKAERETLCSTKCRGIFDGWKKIHIKMMKLFWWEALIKFGTGLTIDT